MTSNLYVKKKVKGEWQIIFSISVILVFSYPITFFMFLISFYFDIVSFHVIQMYVLVILLWALVIFNSIFIFLFIINFL